MNHFTTSDGIRLAYVIDDFTDPWKPPETLVLLHAAMGSSRRLYAWVPTLARISLWVTVVLTFTSGALYLWRNRALYLDDL